MARWKVTNKHYIRAEQWGQPTQWERQETNTATGRMFRKALDVPLYIDPEDPTMFNRAEGFVVVSREKGAKPGDIIFWSKPTVDMEPLDDEAQAETDAEKDKWVDPINSLPLQIGEDAGAAILRSMEQAVASIGLVGVGQSLKGGTNPDVEDLKRMVQQQQEQINRLLQTPTVAPEQVVNTEPPLVDVELDGPPAPPPIKVNVPRRRI